MSRSKTLHEKYHSETKPQQRVVRSNNFTYRLLISVVEEYIKKVNQNIIDIGCGAGTLSLYLASKGHNILGIDISSRAINECLKSAKMLKLKNADFKQFDFPNTFPNKKFDSVIFTEVIEHLDNDKLALDTINNLLQPGGLVILSTPSAKAPLHKLGLTKKFDKEVGHIRRYNLKNLIKIIKSSGFEILEIKKTEGILRNFLFVNSYAGKLVRFLNHFNILSDIATLLDGITLKLFGESNIIIVARKKG